MLVNLIVYVYMLTAAKGSITYTSVPDFGWSVLQKSLLIAALSLSGSVTKTLFIVHLLSVLCSKEQLMLNKYLLMVTVIVLDNIYIHLEILSCYNNSSGAVLSLPFGDMRMIHILVLNLSLGFP